MGSRVTQALLRGSTKLEKMDERKETEEQRWTARWSQRPGPKYVGKDRNQEKARGHSGFCRHVNAWVGLADVHRCQRSQDSEGYGGGFCPPGDLPPLCLRIPQLLLPNTASGRKGPCLNAELSHCSPPS